MVIRANNKEITVKSIFSDTFRRNGKVYPALRFEFENEAPEENIESLLSGEFEILDDDGNVVGTHDGYTTLKCISVVIGKVTRDEEKIEALEASLAESEAKNEELSVELENKQAENNALTADLENAQAEKVELQNAVDVMVSGNMIDDGGNEE